MSAEHLEEEAIAGQMLQITQGMPPGEAATISVGNMTSFDDAQSSPHTQSMEVPDSETADRAPVSHPRHSHAPHTVQNRHRHSPHQLLRRKLFHGHFPIHIHIPLPYCLTFPCPHWVDWPSSKDKWAFDTMTLGGNGGTACINCEDMPGQPDVTPPERGVVSFYQVILQLAPESHPRILRVPC